MQIFIKKTQKILQVFLIFVIAKLINLNIE